MKINKLKYLTIAICCLVVASWSEAKSMENLTKEKDTYFKIYTTFQTITPNIIAMCFEASPGDVIVKLANEKNVDDQDQRWKIVPQEDDTYKIYTTFQTAENVFPMCFEASPTDVIVKLANEKNADDQGQRWKIVPQKDDTYKIYTTFQTITPNIIAMCFEASPTNVIVKLANEKNVDDQDQRWKIVKLKQ